MEPAETKKIVREEPPFKVLQKNFKSSEYAYARFSVVLPEGATIKDTLRPEAWSSVAHVLQTKAYTGEPDLRGAIIEVRTVDHSMFAELYVRAVQDNGLTVQLMRDPVKLGPQVVKDETKFFTRWNVGARGFDIIRKSDDQLVGAAKDFPLKEQALAWIEETTKG